MLGFSMSIYSVSAANTIGSVPACSTPTLMVAVDLKGDRF